jgi:hypothetical protein
VAGGMPPPSGPPPGGGAQGAAEATSGTSSTYVAAADTDGDGTVSEEEQAAYDKKVASGDAGSGASTGSKGAAGKPDGPAQRDPVREPALAMDLLKAYADNGTSAAATGSTASSSVSVEA